MACAVQVKACAIRVTELDETGAPDPGADSMYVSDALVSMGFTTEITEGDDIDIPNACGESIVVQGDDLPTSVSIELQIREPDPKLVEKLGGGEVLTDGGDEGYAAPRLNQIAKPNGVSIELWTKRYLSTGQPDTANPYNWWVFPLVRLNVNDATFENGPFQPTFNGTAFENENWLDGPTNDWAVTSTSAYQFMPTATIPTPDCDYVAVVAS
jgi:hypothetical protein